MPAEWTFIANEFRPHHKLQILDWNTNENECKFNTLSIFCLLSISVRPISHTITNPIFDTNVQPSFFVHNKMFYQIKRSLLDKKRDNQIHLFAHRNELDGVEKLSCERKIFFQRYINIFYSNCSKRKNYNCH